MAQNTDLVIKDFQSGIASSPHQGYGDMRNLDIYTLPGIVRLNNLTGKQSGTVVTGLPLWLEVDPSNSLKLYALDEVGVSYVSGDQGSTWAVVLGNAFTVTIASPAVFSATAHGLASGDSVVFSTTIALPTGLTAGTTYYVIAAGLTANAFEVSTSLAGSAVNTSGSQSGTHSFRCTTGAVGQGQRIWKDYLIVARAAAIDCYGPLSSSPAWTNNFQVIDTDAEWHPMIISNNDSKLYGGAGRYIFSLAENAAPFTPATAGSYTWTKRALDLLAGSYRVKCLAELGNNLEIGTWIGTQLLGATLFSWDRSSSSFGQPISFQAVGINQMIEMNGLLYLQIGSNGKYYQSNGVSVGQITQIPDSVIPLTGGKRIQCYPGAITKHLGRLFVGLSIQTNSDNIGGMGVWSLNPTSKGTILVFENVISTGNYGTSSNVRIGALVSTFNRLLSIGWQDSTTYGIDRVDSSNRYVSYAGYFESPFYQVGTPLQKKMFTQGEFQLVSPLATGQGVIVKYRTDILTSFTTIGTYDYATLGAVSSHNFTPDIPLCEFIQIRVELTANASSALSPELRSVTLR